MTDEILTPPVPRVQVKCQHCGAMLSTADNKVVAFVRDASLIFPCATCQGETSGDMEIIVGIPDA